ncbi:MAG: hypothetical protein IKK66_01225 [Ruminococcus sp.]|nr:hypothetical protein [Ruminococcus sp.]
MGDAMNRITDILKDEESLRQLSELADMLKSGEFAENSAETNCAAEESAENAGFMPDMSMMLKITSLAGAMNEQDKNTELLLALRPHLSHEAQQRLDKAVKILKLISVYETAKESGMLNNII